MQGPLIDSIRALRSSDGLIEQLQVPAYNEVNVMGGRGKH